MYLEHRIGKQNPKFLTINTPNLEKSILNTILKVVQISQIDIYVEIHAHIAPWRCSVHNGQVYYHATVHQKGNNISSHQEHSHISIQTTLALLTVLRQGKRFFKKGITVHGKCHILFAADKMTAILSHE